MVEGKKSWLLHWSTPVLIKFSSWDPNKRNHSCISESLNCAIRLIIDYVFWYNPKCGDHRTTNRKRIFFKIKFCDTREARIVKKNTLNSKIVPFFISSVKITKNFTNVYRFRYYRRIKSFLSFSFEVKITKIIPSVEERANISKTSDISWKYLLLFWDVFGDQLFGYYEYSVLI